MGLRKPEQRGAELAGLAPSGSIEHASAFQAETVVGAVLQRKVAERLPAGVVERTVAVEARDEEEEEVAHRRLEAIGLVKVVVDLRPQHRVGLEAPEDVASRFNLAQALERSGRPAEALAEYERILALAPHHPHAAARRAALASSSAKT